jgi:hypothetical protein
LKIHDDNIRLQLLYFVDCVACSIHRRRERRMMKLSSTIRMECKIFTRRSLNDLDGLLGRPRLQVDGGYEERVFLG